MAKTTQPPMPDFATMTPEELREMFTEDQLEALGMSVSKARAGDFQDSYDTAYDAYNSRREELVEGEKEKIAAIRKEFKASREGELVDLKSALDATVTAAREAKVDIVKKTVSGGAGNGTKKPWRERYELLVKVDPEDDSKRRWTWMMSGSQVASVEVSNDPETAKKTGERLLADYDLFREGNGKKAMSASFHGNMISRLSVMVSEHEAA
jgi:hypothetical protein